MAYSPFMTQDEYYEIWKRLTLESDALANKRSDLEVQLDEIKNEIAHLEEARKHFAPLAGMSYGDIAGLGITDAIRSILENAKQRMSPADVRKALTNEGFDLSGYSAPMSSIYKILSRLADDVDSPVNREKDGNAVFYVWSRPAAEGYDQRPSGGDEYAQSSEITDDDIPF